VAGAPGRAFWRHSARLFLGFWIERLRCQLSAGLLEQNFHFTFGLFQVFWQSRESWTPSSNSFMASSSERFALSSFRTISSRRASECSKSGFFEGSVFFAGVGFTVVNSLYRWQRIAKIGRWSKPAF